MTKPPFGVNSKCTYTGGLHLQVINEPCVVELSFLCIDRFRVDTHFPISLSVHLHWPAKTISRFNFPTLCNFTDKVSQTMDLIESLNIILRHFFSDSTLTFKCGFILGLFLCHQLQISPAQVSYEKKNVVSHFTSWFDSRPFHLRGQF